MTWAVTQDPRAYSGRAIMRPACAVEACGYGSWTVRGGYVTGANRRPTLGCQGTFAVAAAGHRLVMALSSAPTGADDGLTARMWVHDAIDTARGSARFSASSVLRTVLTGRPSATDDSLLVAVLPGTVPPGGGVRGTLAMHGRRVDSWLVTGGTATRHRRESDSAEIPIDVNDGEVWCATTTGRTPDIASVWGLPPTPAEFIAGLGDADADCAMVALWAGHCANGSS